MTVPVVALVIGAIAVASWQNPGQRPVFRGSTDAVAIDVSVQKRNAPVNGLREGDFGVTDNGVAQSAKVQTIADVPADVSVVFDRSLAGQISIGTRYDAALRKIADALRPTDRLRVVEYASDVREVRPLSPVNGSTGSVVPDMASGAFAMGPRNRGGELVQNALHDPNLQRDSVFDALLLAMAKPPEPGRRHLIVQFTFGVESGSILTDGALLSDVAARTDALIQIGWWNRRIVNYAVDGTQSRYTRSCLASAATATGGGARDFDDVVGAFKSIFADFVQSYLITYDVSGVQRSGWHTVKVTIPGHPEYTVHARSGYVGH